MRRRHFPQVVLRERGPTGIDENHGPLELQHTVVRLPDDHFVQASERVVVLAIFGGKFGQDEFVGIFGELLGHRGRAQGQRSEQHQDPLLHCVHGITRF